MIYSLLISFLIFLASLPSAAADYVGNQNADELINSRTKELNLKLLEQMQSTANQRRHLQLTGAGNSQATQTGASGQAGISAGLSTAARAMKAALDNSKMASPTQKIANENVSRSAQYGAVNMSLNMSGSGAHAEMAYGNNLKASASFDGSARIELSHPLGLNKAVNFIHDNGPYGGTEDKLGFRWGF